MALRWLLVDRTRNTSFTAFITFAFVALVINVVILLLWRWPFAFNNSIREREKR
jgi:cytochrome c oxidase assembly factor CtaG